MDRWNSGLSNEITNDATEYLPDVTGAEIHNLVNRCNEIITDYETGGNAKLNTVLALSDLELPAIE